MVVYILIFGILNLVGKLAIGDPSTSSHVIPPSEALIYFNLYSSLSMRAWVSSEVVVDIVTRGGTLGLCITFSFMADLLAFRVETFSVIIQSMDS